MENKIDLDAIMKKINPIFYRDIEAVEPISTTTKECMKEAIHQALVLASKKAKISRGLRSVAGDGVFSINNLYVSGILDVEKLII